MDAFHDPTYGRCFQSLALGIAPLFILFGIAALFGANTVRVNGHPVHGPMALLYAGGMILLLAGLFAAFQKFGFFLLGTMQGRAPANEA